MRKSKQKANVRSARGADQERLLRAEARAQRGRQGRLARFGWPLCALGVVLFLAGYFGSLAGVAVLPFDQHHFISQAGGLGLAIVGLIWATRRPT